LRALALAHASRRSPRSHVIFSHYQFFDELLDAAVRAARRLRGAALCAAVRLRAAPAAS